MSRRILGVVVGLIAVGLLGHASAAQAASTISVTVGANPIESLPTTVTVAGTTDSTDAYVTATYKPVSVGGCAAQPEDDVGSGIVRFQSVDSGQYSVSGDVTFDTAQPFLICVWLEDLQSTILATTSTTTPVALPNLSLSIQPPRVIRPGKKFSFKVTALAQAKRQLTVDVLHDATGACPPDPGAVSSPVDEPIDQQDVEGGPLTLTADSVGVERVGDYLLCGWLVYSGPDGDQVETSATAVVASRAAPRRPKPIPLPQSKSSLSKRLHISFGWTWTKHKTTLKTVKLPRRLPARLGVKIACKGPGCRRHHTVTAKGTRAVRHALKRLVGQSWRPKSRLILHFHATRFAPYGAEAKFRAARAPAIFALT